MLSAAPHSCSPSLIVALPPSFSPPQVLLDAGATLELQDALGRSALMFAAGNNAPSTLAALLDAGACISQRDRRLRCAEQGGEYERRPRCREGVT